MISTATTAGADRPLRIGINLMFLVEESGGAGRYARELVPAILRVEPKTRVTAFINRDAPRDLPREEWAGGVEWVRYPVGIGSPPWHLVAQFAAIPVAARRRRLDVIHSPANVGPVHAPGCATVVTLLDLIWLHQGEKWGTGRERLTMRNLSLFCARRADRVIAISRAARDDFVRAIGLDPDRIDVTLLGVRSSRAMELDPALQESARMRRRLGIGNAPLVLCVAQKRAYKNLGSLVRAVAELDGLGAQLALVGSSSAHEAELRSLAQRLGVRDRVHFLGWVSEADLEALYGLAQCFVLPSLIEGFGLPVLEAMKRGVPVACSNRGSLPEVAGDAAVVFDPENQASVTSAVRRLLGDGQLARELGAKGRERAHEFTWERTAHETLTSYRRAIAARSR